MATRKKKKEVPTSSINGVLAQSEMADSTREQQEAHVRSIGRPCAGPLMYEPKREQRGFEAWRELQAADDVKGALRMIATLGAAAEKVSAPGVRFSVPPPPEGDDIWPALRRIAFPLIRLRGSRIGFPCTEDHNDLICQEAFDGAEHTVACPGCDTAVSWTSPVFY